MAPQLLKLAVSQSYTLNTLSETLAQLVRTTHSAALQGVDILLFPEAYLGGYPRTCNFGTAIGTRSDDGREQFLSYFKSAVDLGDTHAGAEDAWLERRLPVDSETGRRGDGTREALENVARLTGVFIVTGLVERAGGSMFCSAVYVCPKRGVVGKRRKLMPTGTERLVWSQGVASSLKAVTATIKGVRVVMGCAICWENFMPLLRYSIYSQGVNLWFAPTADARDTWSALVRTIAHEGRCFVMSSNQCQKRSQLPKWIQGSSSQSSSSSSTAAAAAVNGGGGSTGPSRLSRRKSVTTKDNHEISLPASLTKEEPHVNGDSSESAVAVEKTTISDDYVSRGGSCIVGPMGTFMHPPVWENSEDLITADVDFDDCARGKLDFDATGHYSRSDQFHLNVEGLDLIPPA